MRPQSGCGLPDLLAESHVGPPAIRRDGGSESHVIDRRPRSWCSAKRLTGAFEAVFGAARVLPKDEHAVRPGSIRHPRNQNRPHRAGRLIPPSPKIRTTMTTELSEAKLRRRPVLGGLINEYERAT
jgi:putative transposase